MRGSRHAALALVIAGCVTATPQQTPPPDVADAGMLDAGVADVYPLTPPPPSPPVDGNFSQLFDGVGFANWDRYLGIPNGGSTALGIDNDPRGVFSVMSVDGEPALRITGEVWGALISKEELSNFELRLQYKWGTLLFPPLNAFDSGVMVLSTGALGAVNAGGPGLSNPVGSGAFMVSVEFQIAAGDIGGLYALGPIAIQPTVRNPLPELPGVWNQVAIVVRGTSSEHYLNGKLVTTGSGYELQLPGQPVVPLSRGKIQLQSEGSEIYFRHVELRLLD